MSLVLGCGGRSRIPFPLGSCSPRSNFEASKVSTACCVYLMVIMSVLSGCWVHGWLPAPCKLWQWFGLHNCSLPYNCSFPGFMTFHPTHVQISIQPRFRDPWAEFWKLSPAWLLSFQHFVCIFLLPWNFRLCLLNPVVTLDSGLPLLY